MPPIDNVSVTNINSGVNWVTGQQATAPNLPLPPQYNVYVNGAQGNQPPAGFLNNPNHQFVVQGRYMASGQAFTSGLLRINPGMSEPPRAYVFS